MDVVDEVHLRLPPGTQHVKLARLVAVGLATDLGMDYDDVEDLRLAVGELCFVLVSHAGGSGSVPLEITYKLRPRGLEIRGSCQVLDPAGDDELADLTVKILEVAVDEYEMATRDGRCSFRMTKDLKD